MLGKTPDKNKKNANMSLVSDDLDSSLKSTSSTKYSVRSLSRATNKNKYNVAMDPWY